MPTVSRSSDLSIGLDPLARIEAGAPPKCECRHTDTPDRLCGDAAVARATVVCAEEGCECAAGVSLLCQACLAVWRKWAARDGVTLRVTPL